MVSGTNRIFPSNTSEKNSIHANRISSKPVFDSSKCKFNPLDYNFNHASLSSGDFKVTRNWVANMTMIAVGVSFFAQSHFMGEDLSQRG